MPNNEIFCSSPWYELHIYWDGSLAFCCHATPRVPYDLSLKKTYNIKNMSVKEWYDSEAMRKARLHVLSDQQWDHCNRCWHEENVGLSSRRHRSNQKAVIFRQNFKDSFDQSPGYENFKHSIENNGAYDGMPVDLHIDLGNYCNLACKMCNPYASSRIASQHTQWGILDVSTQDWTADQEVWDRFKHEIVAVKKLKNVHFMGGETLIQPRFLELVDFLIENNRTDVSISFVTNGTTYNDGLIDKLKLFPRVGIEVSIETMDRLNDYVRQGTDTVEVIKNIGRYLSECNGSSITVTLRPAPGLLTIKSYWQVIEYALQNNLIVKSNLCTEPEFLHLDILPAEVKKTYKAYYQDLYQRWQLENVKFAIDANESDPNNFRAVAKNQITQILNMLDAPEPENCEALRTQLVQHLNRWDPVYKFNARELYPELRDMLDKHGYNV
jgi:pyruvate-formate lyase-activating enzyme